MINWVDTNFWMALSCSVLELGSSGDSILNLVINTVPLITRANWKYTNETLEQGTSCSFTLTRSHVIETHWPWNRTEEWSGGKPERLRTVRTCVISASPTSPVILLTLSYSSPQTFLQLMNLSSLQVKNSYIHTKHGFPRSYTIT